MNHGSTWCTTLLSMAIATTALAQEPSARPASSILSTLRPAHPRLFLHQDEIPRLGRLIETNADARKLRDQIHERAVRLLGEPPVEHKLVGPRLLSQSRTCLDRVSTLGLIYLLEGDRRFAERAEKEMLTAAAFPDWNPSHFLDTAEMSNALGIGYDWLYDFLSAESRKTIRDALVSKGLEPGLEVYRKDGWWAKCHHNWNQVCNGGLTVGALAIADEVPELAANIVAHARRSIPLAMSTLEPDGGWPEGPGYWNYAMRYTAYYHSALLTALGTDFGLTDSPGYADAGMFRIHCMGPTLQTFNFADGGSAAGNAALMMFLSRRFDRPVYAWHQRTYRGTGEAFELVWYDPRGSEADIRALPLDAHFRGIDVVFMRSAWNDPDALFVGFKGGDNAANHSNLDLGTFVLDGLGERWAVELGADDYNLPGYWGSRRWTYYRLKTQGQNTLVLDDENQATKAKAPVVAFRSSPEQALALADLSAGYAARARRVCRGVAMLGRKQVLIQDELTASRSAEALWTMHTPAKVAVTGRDAVLTLNRKRMVARLLEPADAVWAVEEVTLDPPQRPLTGIRKILVRTHLPAETPSRIRVLIAPEADVNASLAPPPQDLAAWADAR